jgi:DtxR family Mn-dependent transcriptional regulator
LIGLISHSVQEYLEAIYYFNEKRELAKNADLAKRLNVSPPSVTQMIKRLADEGLVKHQPYKGTALTGAGVAHAQKVVRKHRLLERFFHDILGMAKEKVHNEACRMEHSLSDEAAIALCRTLDNPATCPDDLKTLPACTLDVADCEECLTESPEASTFLLTELSNLKPGERGKVAFIRAGTTAYQRLLDMGLTKGTVVEVINAAPFHGPLEVSLRGAILALGRGLAARVFVEVLNGDLEMLPSHPHGPYHSK